VLDRVSKRRPIPPRSDTSVRTKTSIRRNGENAMTTLTTAAYHLRSLTRRTALEIAASVAAVVTIIILAVALALAHATRLAPTPIGGASLTPGTSSVQTPDCHPSKYVHPC
jgi:ABC-type Co2+ transport system permease subunit